MEKYDLDLDALKPEVKYVKLNDRIIEVNPPKFKNIVAISKLVRQTQTATSADEQMDIIGKFTDELIPLVPALKEKDFDLTFEQMNTLITFITNMASPQQKQEVEKVVRVAKKK